MKVLAVNKFYYMQGGSESYYFGLNKLLEENNITFDDVGNNNKKIDKYKGWPKVNAINASWLSRVRENNFDGYRRAVKEKNEIDQRLNDWWVEENNKHNEEYLKIKEKLMNSAQALFSKVYEQAQGAAGAAGMNPEDFAKAAQDSTANSNTGFNKDDVVDGDYKEI